MTALLGIDCATEPRKTGLALGELRGDIVHILKCSTATLKTRPADLAAEWLAPFEDALIGLDAPLGWPLALGRSLSGHAAGQPLRAERNDLFSRAADRSIRERFGKRPLEVGADRIARTAHAALELLNALRSRSGRPIPLAWTAAEESGWRVIEVYPACTRLGHGAPDRGGCLDGLDQVLDCTAVLEVVRNSADAADAAVCALAAADMLRGKAFGPTDLEVARSEGWIWALPHPT